MPDHAMTERDLIIQAADFVRMYMKMYVEKNNHPDADPVIAPRGAVEWLQNFENWRRNNA